MSIPLAHRLWSWLSALPVLALLAAGPLPAQDVTVFRDVSVIPMDTPAERVLTGQNVVVRDGRIAAMGAAAQVPVPAGARVVEGNGHFLLPGLAEMHAHVPPGADRDFIGEVLFLYVANGVTTARGMLGEPAHLQLREQLRNNSVLGPRLYTSGPSLNARLALQPEAAARLVREQAAAGYDFVKVHPGPARGTYDAAVRAAAESGIRLAGHVPAAVGVERAIEARQATIDHLDGYVEALGPEARRMEGGFFGLDLAADADRSRLPGLVSATVAAGVWVVPTLTLIEHWPAATPTLEQLLARPEMAYVSGRTREQWAGAKRQITGGPGYDPQRATALVNLRRELVKALHDGGARLLLGSDAPQVFNVPGFSLHREIASMHGAGLSAYEVLRTGTALPAEFFGATQEFGTVRTGLAADLLLVEGNPLEDLSRLARPAGVMVRGRWLDRATLDARLAAIAERHRR
jgi:imidazolonepropionase-like amidohydrolase